MKWNPFANFTTVAVLAGLLEAGGLVRADSTGAALTRASVLEGNVAYLRVGRVATGLADELAAARRTLAVTNEVVGTVLDLRFADGDDSAAMKRAAEVFTARKFPLAILVDGETRGTAAALAAALRTDRAGLVFGSATAGVKPDIAVAVSTVDEKVYFMDPYLIVTNLPIVMAGTNSASAVTNHPVRRVSEADLVEARRKGAADPEEELGNSPLPPALLEKPVVHDPVLARALDLLKGLALVRGPHGG